MSIGPLAKVDTLTAGIGLDISRKLNWGKGLTLEFITVDGTDMTGWKVQYTLLKGFDRIIQDEKTTGDGSDVIFEAVDPTLSSDLAPVMRLKDLHVRVDGIIYRVAFVQPVPPNGAQLYTLTCRTRTLRTNFDTIKK